MAHANTAFKIVAEDNDISCTHCGKKVEILNNDVQFSIDLHMQSHKPEKVYIRNLQKQPELEHCDGKESINDNSHYKCPDCCESVEIFNKNVNLSLQLHAENHRSPSTETGCEDQTFTKSSDKSKISEKRQINFKSSSSSLIEQSGGVLENIFSMFQSGPRAHRGFITENEKEKVICNICNLNISPRFKILEHLKTKSHEDKTLCFIQGKIPNTLEGTMTYISFYDSNLLCNLCGCKIDLCSYNPQETIVNILAHNAGKQHSKNNTKTVTPNCEDAFEMLNFLSHISPMVQENKHLIDYTIQFQFKCNLCNKHIPFSQDENITLTNLKSHLSSAGHIKWLNSFTVLDSFKKVFSSTYTKHNLIISRGNIYCTTCNSQVESNTEILNQHVNKNIPNSLCNQGLNCNAPCSNHSSNTKHLSKMEDRYLYKKIMPLKPIIKNLPETGLECYHVNKYVVDVGEGKVACIICSCTLDSTAKNILEHIKGSTHISKVKAFELISERDKVVESKELKAPLQMLPGCSKQSDGVLETKHHNPASSLNVVNTNTIYKEECNTIDDFDFKSNDSNFSLDKVSKFLLINNGTYFCKICSFTIYGSNNVQNDTDLVMVHFFSESHQKALSDKQCQVFQKLLLTTDAVLQANAHYIKKQKGKLVCILCDKAMSTSLEVAGLLNNFVGHFSGKQHVKNLNKKKEPTNLKSEEINHVVENKKS